MPKKRAADARAASAENARAASADVSILVSVEDKHRDQLESVVKQLRSAGMSVADVFPLSCTVAGQAASSDLGKLRQVEGVQAVEEEPTFRAF